MLFRRIRGGEREQKKDLRKVAVDLDLSRAILIDDLPTNVHAGQEKNFLWCQFKNGPTELPRLRGMIDRALHRSRESGTTVVDELWALQWTEESRRPGSTELAFNPEAADADILARGVRKMQKEFPGFTIDAPYLGAIVSRRLPDALEAERAMAAAGSLPRFERRKPLEGPVEPDLSPSPVRVAEAMPEVVIPLPPDVRETRRTAAEAERSVVGPGDVIDPAVPATAADLPVVGETTAPVPPPAATRPVKKRRSMRERFGGCATHLVEAWKSLFGPGAKE
jgi:hypothetical protein